LAAWNEIGRKLITMAEDFPEDNYDGAKKLCRAVAARGRFQRLVYRCRIGEKACR
jgi:hypothetical protein